MMPNEAAMTPEEFAQWIDDREYRHEPLADALGINRTSIYKWLRGTHPVTPIIRLALEAVDSGITLQKAVRPTSGADLTAWMHQYSFDDALLAEALGVHSVSVSRWRTERHPLTDPLRLAIARLASDRHALTARRTAIDARARIQGDAARRLEKARERARAATVS